MSTGIILKKAEIDRNAPADLGVQPAIDLGAGHRAQVSPLPISPLPISPLPILGTGPGAARAAGLALCAPAPAAGGAGEDGEGRFDLWIVDAAGRPAQRLGPFPESEVVAVWRRLGAESGLTLMVVDESGSLATAQPQLGRLRLGAVRTRRGHGLLSGRRPRFLVRRKTARLAPRPRVHRGERVIAGGAEG